MARGVASGFPYDDLTQPNYSYKLVKHLKDRGIPIPDKAELNLGPLHAPRGRPQSYAGAVGGSGSGYSPPTPGRHPKNG